MSDIILPLTAAQTLARLASISSADAQAALAQVSKPVQTPGLAVATAINLSQVQAAVGIRRPFNPFAY